MQREVCISLSHHVSLTVHHHIYSSVLFDFDTVLVLVLVYGDIVYSNRCRSPLVGYVAAVDV